MLWLCLCNYEAKCILLIYFVIAVDAAIGIISIEYIATITVSIADATADAVAAVAAADAAGAARRRQREADHLLRARICHECSRCIPSKQLLVWM